MTNESVICLWCDHNTLDAANFYIQTLPDSRVTAVHHAPGSYPAGKRGDVPTVEFIVTGIPCLGLNGDLRFKHNKAFSS